MLRSLVRSGLVVLFVLSLAAPARALPLAGGSEGFTWSFSALWESLISPIVALWTGGPGTCTGTGQVSGTCDPNGG
jgi:hypothetical protein